MSKQVFQIRKRSILSYWKSDQKTGRTIRQIKSAEALAEFSKRRDDAERQQSTKKTYSGLATVGSRKRLTRAIDNLLRIAQWKPLVVGKRVYQFQVNFVTLTLYSYGAKIPGREAHKQCLEPLLLWLRREYGYLNSNGNKTFAYIWRAELQVKRKDCHQLHFHITTDIFIPYQALCDKWNELQEKAGYLDTWFERFGYFKVDKKTGEFKRNLPNSTDIHATHHVLNMASYLAKALNKYSNKRAYERLRHNTRCRIMGEMAKQVQNWETVEGKIWDCSVNVKSVAHQEIEGFADVTKALAYAVELKQLVKVEMEHCTVYECVRKDAFHYLPDSQQIIYHRYSDYIRNFERGGPKIDMELLTHLLRSGPLIGITRDGEAIWNSN